MSTTTRALRPPQTDRSVSASRVVLTAIAVGTLPVLVAAFLVGSTWLGRPLLAHPKWGWLLPRRMGNREKDAMIRRATVYWTLVLLVAGALQIALGVFMGLSMTSAAGVLIRSLAALTLELAAFAVLTRAVVPKPVARATGTLDDGRPTSA